ncbi:hypothetical protein LZ554_006155 [Drepanopeziza brunnea f. sp. 'monogermtubi']|nr:hypothetical protein LZ554_006155 [Drepanopeziza brunnea f. sp. 'monogermtubi']
MCGILSAIHFELYELWDAVLEKIGGAMIKLSTLEVMPPPSLEAIDLPAEGTLCSALQTLKLGVLCVLKRAGPPDKRSKPNR